MTPIDKFGLYTMLGTFIIEFILMLWHREKEILKDAFANILIGGCVVITGLFEKAFAFAFFTFVFQFSFINTNGEWWYWIIAFFACDLIHYLYHLVGHKTRLFWSAHVTHHSSQHFNLSTGLRTNFIHLFYRFLFWSPLCLFGISPEMILFFESLSFIINFMVHTERIGKLGILDYIFNTPSNHRVHHASNPEYLDKNLGGILMIYDHLFGTYAKEVSKPVYGITHNIHTNNPVTILLGEYFKTIRESGKQKNLIGIFRYLFSPPV